MIDTATLNARLAELPALREQTITKLAPTATEVRKSVTFRNQSDAAAVASTALKHGTAFNGAVDSVCDSLKKIGLDPSDVRRLRLGPDEFPIRQLLRTIGHAARAKWDREAAEEREVKARKQYNTHLMRQRAGTVFKLRPSDADLVRISISTPSIDVANRRARFIISTDDVDRQKEVILPSGVDQSDYVMNPVVCWGHMLDEKYIEPIGTSQRDDGTSGVDVHDGQITAWCRFNETPDGEYFWGMVQRGELKACSIHVLPLSAETKYIDGDTITVYTASKLLEWSLVSIGCNQSAVMRSRVRA